MEKLEITAKDLSLVDENLLNAKQLKILLKKTPSQYVHKRPAKGGGQWEYVTGGYVRKVLNLMFGWNWSFEVRERFTEHGEAIVLGRLTCTLPSGQVIVKEQFGNKEIICKRGTENPLSIGNDYKAASTDALKKCAAEIGVAADIYNKQDFKEIEVNTEQLTDEELKLIEKFDINALKCDDLDELGLLVQDTIYDNVRGLNAFKRAYSRNMNRIKLQ